jgi:predicted transcriptional regulator
MSCRDALFLSIRPRFAEQIFDGTKTVELRRVRPRIEQGDLVIVYASGSTKALLGAFQVSGVIASTPNAVWRRFSARTGLTKTEFDAYYDRSEAAFVIEISHAWKLKAPICLKTLRSKRAGFRPPQGYHYLDAAAVMHFGGSALLGHSNRPNRI